LGVKVKRARTFANRSKVLARVPDSCSNYYAIGGLKRVGYSRASLNLQTGLQFISFIFFPFIKYGLEEERNLCGLKNLN
jgi:hypothetical protein